MERINTDRTTDGLATKKHKGHKTGDEFPADGADQTAEGVTADSEQGIHVAPSRRAA
jgi:hypothetical protein